METKVSPKSDYQHTIIPVLTSTQNTTAWISAAVEMAKLYTRLNFAYSVVEVQVTIRGKVAFFYHHVNKHFGSQCPMKAKSCS
jgi:hypothetical protein